VKKIVLGPFTRANNSCMVEVTVENKKVVDAKCCGTFFRGFELILQGRDPRDAGYLTERICGICSSVHGTAAAYALEDAAGIRPPANGNLLRNLILGADFLQNHIRHIYLFSFVDYLKLPEKGPYPFRGSYNVDKRFPSQINDTIFGHLIQSIEISRQAHEMVTLLGGKAPFSQGILAGGSTVPPTADVVMNFRSKLEKINHFVQNIMLPDIDILAEVYRDYYKIGRGKTNLLEYGLFPKGEKDNARHFPGGAVIDGRLQTVDIDVIKEHLSRSWYSGDSEVQHPSGGQTVINRAKEGAYSWVKAPRYNGLAMEGGPLARL